MAEEEEKQEELDGAKAILTAIGAGAVVALVAGGLFALAAILQGVVLSVLWGWFVVPLGLPALGIAHAIGIALVVRFLTHRHTSKKTDDESPIRRELFGLFVLPPLALVAGWVITLFL
jgi:hypothetical protein